MGWSQLAIAGVRQTSQNASKKVAKVVKDKKPLNIGNFAHVAISNFGRKFGLYFGGPLCFGLGVANIAFEYYKNNVSRSLFQYYALEFNVLKQPSRELVEFLVTNFLIPNGLNVEKSRIMSSHVQAMPRKRLSQRMINPLIFYEESTNSVDIYLPQFYEVNGSYGHFLENSGHYFMVQQHKLNTEFFESTNMRYVGVDEYVICQHPSNDEILFRTERAFANRSLISGGTGVGVQLLFMSTIFFSFGCMRAGASLMRQKPVMAGLLTGVLGVQGTEMGRKRYNHEQQWAEEQRLAKKSPQLALGAYTSLEKGRRLNLLAYKMEGHQLARTKIDAQGNIKADKIQLADKLAFAVTNLRDNFDINQLPEIPDEIVEEDQFYF